MFSDRHPGAGWVYTLGTAGWILTFVVLNWQVWMCWSLLILGSSLLTERYGIRLRNESAGAKKHRIVSHEKTSFFRTPKKRHIFSLFRPPNRTSWTTQKAQCKNITRKRETWWKIHPGKFPKKVTFFGILFCTSSSASEKNTIISHKVNSQNIVIFSTSEAKKRQKFDPLRDGWDALIRISIREKETCLSENSPKKFVFLGFFETETAQTWISQGIRN